MQPIDCRARHDGVTIELQVGAGGPTEPHSSVRLALYAAAIIVGVGEIVVAFVVMRAQHG